ncbi:MAG TPA: cysteine-rich CWC family protein [Burkholderiaceae bacterium]|nr:cysteine-rich CWC family protein [Burkholderiaceae bacterium]
MPISPTAPDPSRCPICGQENRCAMEIERETGAKQPPCWCTQVDFNHAVLERIPPQARRMACVCQACATSLQTQPIH